MSLTAAARACAISLTASLALMGCNGPIGQPSPDQLKPGQEAIGQQQPSTPTAGSTDFSVGENWAYAITIETPAGTMTGEVTNTITLIDGDLVTFTSTTVLADNEPTITTKQINLTETDPYIGLLLDKGMSIGTPVIIDETVTVPAGTFPAQMMAYTGTKDGAKMIIYAWVTDDLGVVKYDIVTDVADPALPADASGIVGDDLDDLTTRVVVELKSHSK